MSVFSTEATYPAVRRTSDKGPKTANHWLLIFRLAEGPERGPYLPFPGAVHLSWLPQKQTTGSELRSGEPVKISRTVPAGSVGTRLKGETDWKISPKK